MNSKRNFKNEVAQQTSDSIIPTYIGMGSGTPDNVEDLSGSEYSNLLIQKKIEDEEIGSENFYSP